MQKQITGGNMKIRWKKAAAVLSAAGLLLTAGIHIPQQTMTANAVSQTITNDCFWKDTSGNFIYSQGGGIFKFGDTYYWYGVHYSGAETYAKNPTGKNDDTGFKSITCYSSKDLVNWKFENDVLTPKSKGFGFAYWLGRMGVAYCRKSKKYVLVTQYNDSVLFAQCDTPTGNFEVKNVQDQIEGVQKQGTGDQTVFVDDDGQAYLIASNKGGRAHQYVCRLRPNDFLAAEKAVEVKKGSGREGNCMFKYKNKYYFCASDLHGWNASHSYYMVADNINGPYSDWKVMDGTDMDFSHVTQTGFFYTVKGSKQETVIFCGDRWSDFAGNGLGYNQWVPLTVNGNNVKFNSLSEWNLDAQTGEWSVGAGNNYVLNPSFEADRVSQSTLAGWKASGSGCGNANGARTGRWCGQLYSGSNFSGSQSQAITLPNGTYTLKAYYKTSGMNSGKIYISGYGGNEKSVDVKAKTDNWKEITISDIQVTNGKCTVGFEAAGSGGAWLKVDDFSLIGNGQPAPPPEPVKYADGKYITGLTVSDTACAANWSVVTQPKQQGSEVFGDRAFKFTSMPKTLDGAEWIQTACDSKKFAGNEATFKAGADISAFVALDTRVTVPAWLGDWTKTADTLTDDGDPQVTYQLYKKDFAAGQTVTLGEVNQSSCVNYAVAVTAKQAAPVIGDINADGTCDLADLVMMHKYLLRSGDLTPAQGKAADMNRDGKISAKDLTLLKRILTGAK
jgi:hypothetical protein